MAERSNAAVLKTVDCNRSGGSNPSFSAKSQNPELLIRDFFIYQIKHLYKSNLNVIFYFSTIYYQLFYMFETKNI